MNELKTQIEDLEFRSKKIAGLMSVVQDAVCLGGNTGQAYEDAICMIADILYEYHADMERLLDDAYAEDKVVTMRSMS